MRLLVISGGHRVELDTLHAQPCGMRSRSGVPVIRSPPASLRSQETVVAVEHRPVRGMLPHGRPAPTTGDVLVGARPSDDPPGADTDRVAASGIGPLDA